MAKFKAGINQMRMNRDRVRERIREQRERVGEECRNHH